MARATSILLASACAITLLGACESTPVKVGDTSAKTTATGAAAGSTSEGASTGLERCVRPLGTLAVLEDQGKSWYRTLHQEYRLDSTVPLLRLLVQQSNCFIVVERGKGMSGMEKERELERSGELRQDSNFSKGQMVAADYGLTPEVIFSERDTGGVGAAIGGLSRRLRVLGAIAGSLKFHEAQAMLLLVDNRSGVQLGVAEGSASKTDLKIFGGVLGRGPGVGLGGYSNTPQGKVIAGAFSDAYNQLVKVVKNYQPQQSPTGGGVGTGGALEMPQ